MNAWIRDPAKARVHYGGEIGDWDVSRVTDMYEIFCGYEIWCRRGDLCAAYQAFNEPLNGWNTSAVTNMDCVFWGASGLQLLFTPSRL